MSVLKQPFYGLKFPLSADALGGLAQLSESDEIEQSIRTILLTAKGERAMRPDFGSKLSTLHFQPQDAHLLTTACRYAREALTRWEPRIEIIKIEAVPSDACETRPTLKIRYRNRKSAEERATEV